MHIKFSRSASCARRNQTHPAISVSKPKRKFNKELNRKISSALLPPLAAISKKQLAS